MAARMKGPPSGGRGITTRLRTAKTRSTSSQKWLERQLNDPYVRAAQAAGYRSRAAFKLVEIDDRLHLLKPRGRVVDLGAAPGGWTQVALQRIGEAGKVVALDLLLMDPVPGAIVLQGDFQDPAAEQAVLAALDGQADLVLSDMAPNTTGHNATDHLRIIALAELALDFAIRVLSPGGAFVAKVFQGGTEKDLLDLLKQRFATVRHVKPPASRKDSAELYVVATGFRAASPG
jgi:23S rRNA (uridine2552-2'-O)-methyltransferase